MSFVARTDGRWELSVAGAEEPTAIDLAALEETIARASTPPDGIPLGLVEVGADDAVEPLWCWVGRLVDHGVVVEDRDGVARLLTSADLALLDALDEPRTVRALADIAPDGAARLGGLAAAGLIRLAAPAGPPQQAPSPSQELHPSGDDERRPPAPARSGPIGRSMRWLATAYRLSSKLAPVRDRLDRWLPSPSQAAAAPEASIDEPPVPPMDAVDVPQPSGPTDPDDAPVDTARHPADAGPPGRIPVYAVWHPEVGPLLSLGMLTAAARHHDGGTLNETYEIRRPETAASFLADLDRRGGGPAILLCSDYVWSLEANLALAAEARARNPQVQVWHGGPSSPKYPDDATDFLDRHGAVADVLVRGEGEEVVCELLAAVAPGPADPTALQLDPERLAAIGGLTFRGSDGSVVRTPDRDRISALDELVSPYLTGEFDHIHPDAWNQCMPVETNRGCPYSCTFCDWGSSTMSRIRTFSLERVRAEIDWSAAHRVGSFMIADANFGILKRDVEIAEHIAELRRATGFPTRVTVTPAKNTVRHLVRITDTLVRSGVVPTLSISLQTVDPETLAAIDRANISVDAYLELAADYRRHGLPLLGDVLVGMPGQSYDTYRTDLQFNLDHEILVRTWPVQVLPNAPMNDPGYRARHRIETDEHHVVVSTATFGPAERARMFRLRRAFVTFEVFGVARHLARWLQWDHDLPALSVIERIVERCDEAPGEYPHLAWLIGHFDLYTVPPVGWSAVCDELARFVVDELAIGPSEELDAVLAVQRHLLARPGRQFPATVSLARDYPAYYRDATATLYTTGRASGPPRPLAQYPPGDLTVEGDPMELCTYGTRLHGDSRNEVMQGDFYLASTSAYELDSPLARVLPHVGTVFPRATIERLVDRYRTEIDAHRASASDPVAERLAEARVRLRTTEPVSPSSG